MFIQEAGRAQRGEGLGLKATQMGTWVKLLTEREEMGMEIKMQGLYLKYIVPAGLL